MIDLIEIDVYPGYSEFENVADTAKVYFTYDLVDKIKTLSVIAENNEITYVSIYDYSPEFYQDGNETRMECQMLKVSATEFWWTAVHKHTDISIYTERTKVSALDVIGE